MMEDRQAYKESAPFECVLLPDVAQKVQKISMPAGILFEDGDEDEEVRRIKIKQEPVDWDEYVGPELNATMEEQVQHGRQPPVWIRPPDDPPCGSSQRCWDGDDTPRIISAFSLNKSVIDANKMQIQKKVWGTAQQPLLNLSISRVDLSDSPQSKCCKTHQSEGVFEQAKHDIELAKFQQEHAKLPQELRGAAAQKSSLAVVPQHELCREESLKNDGPSTPQDEEVTIIHLPMEEESSPAVAPQLETCREELLRNDRSSTPQEEEVTIIHLPMEEESSSVLMDKRPFNLPLSPRYKVIHRSIEIVQSSKNTEGVFVNESQSAMNTITMGNPTSKQTVTHESALLKESQQHPPATLKVIPVARLMGICLDSPPKIQESVPSSPKPLEQVPTASLVETLTSGKSEIKSKPFEDMQVHYSVSVAKKLGSTPPQKHPHKVAPTVQNDSDVVRKASVEKVQKKVATKLAEKRDSSPPPSPDIADGGGGFEGEMRTEKDDSPSVSRPEHVNKEGVQVLAAKKQTDKDNSHLVVRPNIAYVQVREGRVGEADKEPLVEVSKKGISPSVSANVPIVVSRAVTMPPSSSKVNEVQLQFPCMSCTINFTSQPQLDLHLAEEHKIVCDTNNASQPVLKNPLDCYQQFIKNRNPELYTTDDAEVLDEPIGESTKQTETVPLIEERNIDEELAHLSNSAPLPIVPSAVRVSKTAVTPRVVLTPLKISPTFVKKVTVKTKLKRQKQIMKKAKCTLDMSGQVKWLCNLCEHQCSSNHELLNHCTQDHEGLSLRLTLQPRGGRGFGKFKCDICGCRFLTARLFTDHKLRHFPVKPFPCKYCDKRYTDLTAVKYHYLTVHSSDDKKSVTVSSGSGKAGSEKSTATPPVFKNPDELIMQKILAYMKGPGWRRQCAHCQRAYQSPLSLLEHCYTSHPEKFDTKVISVKGKDKSKKGRYACGDCEFRFEARNLLMYHLLEHFGILRFSCTLCNKAYASYMSLRNHYYAQHRGKFLSTGKLNAVMERTCEYCTMLFETSKALLLHMDQDHPEALKQKAAFKCQECKRRFKTKNLLREHIKLHLSNTVFVADTSAPQHVKLNIYEDASTGDRFCLPKPRPNMFLAPMKYTNSTEKLRKLYCDRYNLLYAVRKSNLSQRLSAKRSNALSKSSLDTRKRERKKRRKSESSIVPFVSAAPQRKSWGGRYLCKYCDECFNMQCLLNFHVKNDHLEEMKAECLLAAQCFNPTESSGSGSQNSSIMPSNSPSTAAAPLPNGAPPVVTCGHHVPKSVLMSAIGGEKMADKGTKKKAFSRRVFGKKRKMAKSHSCKFCGQNFSHRMLLKIHSKDHMNTEIEEQDDFSAEPHRKSFEDNTGLADIAGHESPSASASERKKRRSDKRFLCMYCEEDCLTQGVLNYHYKFCKPDGATDNISKRGNKARNVLSPLDEATTGDELNLTERCALIMSPETDKTCLGKTDETFDAAGMNPEYSTGPINKENKVRGEDKSFNCEICGARFKTQIWLSKHVTARHPSSLVNSEVPNSTHRSPPLKRSPNGTSRRSFAPMPYNCGHCCEGFKAQSLLNWHIKKLHPEEMKMKHRTSWTSLHALPDINSPLVGGAATPENNRVSEQPLQLDQQFFNSESGASTSEAVHTPSIVATESSAEDDVPLDPEIEKCFSKPPPSVEYDAPDEVILEDAVMDGDQDQALEQCTNSEEHLGQESEEKIEETIPLPRDSTPGCDQRVVAESVSARGDNEETVNDAPTSTTVISQAEFQQPSVKVVNSSKSLSIFKKLSNFLWPSSSTLSSTSEEERAEDSLPQVSTPEAAADADTRLLSGDQNESESAVPSTLIPGSSGEIVEENNVASQSTMELTTANSASVGASDTDCSAEKMTPLYLTTDSSATSNKSQVDLPFTVEGIIRRARDKRRRRRRTRLVPKKQEQLLIARAAMRAKKHSQSSTLPAEEFTDPQSAVGENSSSVSEEVVKAKALKKGLDGSFWQKPSADRRRLSERKNESFVVYLQRRPRVKKMEHTSTNPTLESFVSLETLGTEIVENENTMMVPNDGSATQEISVPEVRSKFIRRRRKQKRLGLKRSIKKVPKELANDAEVKKDVNSTPALDVQPPRKKVRRTALSLLLSDSPHSVDTSESPSSAASSRKRAIEGEIAQDVILSPSSKTPTGAPSNKRIKKMGATGRSVTSPAAINRPAVEATNSLVQMKAPVKISQKQETKFGSKTLQFHVKIVQTIVCALCNVDFKTMTELKRHSCKGKNVMKSTEEQQNGESSQSVVLEALNQKVSAVRGSKTARMKKQGIKKRNLSQLFCRYCKKPFVLQGMLKRHIMFTHSKLTKKVK